MRWLLHVFVASIIAVGFAVAQPPPAVRLTPASAVVPAVLDVVRTPHRDREYIRYVSLYNTFNANPAALPVVRALVAFAANSLSRHENFSLPVPVTDTLLRVNLRELCIDPRVFDKLVSTGSGIEPIPQPYFRYVKAVVKETLVDVYRGDEFVRTKTKRSVAFHTRRADWLPEVEERELERQTGTCYPIVRADWLIYYGLIEPRYHELLGLGESDEGIKKITATDEKTADRVGAQARGAVLFGGVTNHNRILERTPSPLRYGDGYSWRSLDFASSIVLDDVLADPLNNNPAAEEYIFSLPNGLQGYLITDGNDKRLDKAVADVAPDRGGTFRDLQVWTARNCMICHTKGMVPFNDEVRLHASDEIALLVKGMEKHGHDDDARRIRQKYMQVDMARLVRKDSINYGEAVKTLTGLSGPAVGRALEDLMVNYFDRPVTLDGLAADLGYDPVTIRGVIERAPTGRLNHVFQGLAKRHPRPARRDQLEVVFGEIAEELLTVPVKEGR